jgi:hypothetical protein
MTLLGLAHRQQLAQDALRCALADLRVFPPMGEPVQWQRSANLVLDLSAAWHHIEPDDLRQQIEALMVADKGVHITLAASGLAANPAVLAAFARAVVDCRATPAVRVVP